ncbi:hypothetical protein [Paraglaciecola sp.]|uniref:hypothetical protein n=1 Tax=Paraglaciecola sp. TaxID=1920173 RepID=UPI003266D6C0
MKHVATILFSILVFACSSQHKAEKKDFEFFGIATLKESQEICLQIRTQEPDKPVAEGYFCYKTDHPKYSKIRGHVGTIQIGESKEFGPFDK